MPTRLRRVLGRFAVVAGIAMAPTMVSAESLSAHAEPFGDIVVRNLLETPFESVTAFSAGAWSIDCAGSQNGPEGAPALLARGEVRCAGRFPDGALRTASVIVAQGEVSGVAATHVSAAAVLGPGEGIVLVAGGSRHNDTNIDGMLDAGESIDYHYTVLNLGDLDLSALAVTDLSGAVSCPQTTLLIGQSMVCTRNYVISGADQTAGLIVNQVDVAGQDSIARPVAASDVLVSMNLAGRADVRLFKSPRIVNDADGNSITSVGDLIEYTFVIKNSGAEQLDAVNLLEPDPDRIDTPIACATMTLGGQAFSGNGSGSLDSHDVLLCSAQYTVRASDAAIQQVLNVAEVEAVAPVAGSVIGTAASTVVVPVPPIIGVSKAVISNTGAGLGPYAVHYMMVVSNLGVVALQDVQVVDDLRTTFPLPVTFEVYDVVVTGTGAANPGFDGEFDTGLLDPASSTLAPGDSMVIDLYIGVRPGFDPGPFMNQVVATGRDSINQSVADLSASGTNPDPDGNGDPDEEDPTPVVFSVPIRPVNVPFGGPLGLLVLVLAVAAGGGYAVRKH